MDGVYLAGGPAALNQSRATICSLRRVRSHFNGADYRPQRLMPGLDALFAIFCPGANGDAAIHSSRRSSRRSIFAIELPIHLGSMIFSIIAPIATLSASSSSLE